MYRRKRISSTRSPLTILTPLPYPPVSCLTPLRRTDKHTRAFDAKNDINAAAQTTNQTNSRQIDTHTPRHTHARQTCNNIFNNFPKSQKKTEIKIKLQNARQIFLSSPDHHHHSAGQLLCSRTAGVTNVSFPTPSYCSLLSLCSCRCCRDFACFSFCVGGQKFCFIILSK